MAVYTEIDFAEARPLFDRLGLAGLREIRGIPSGIENTNYFAVCDRGEFVLTIFERLGSDQLPYYLRLMQHLADRGIPVPMPQADDSGEILFSICGKPAAVVSKLEGEPVLKPTVDHCRQVGAMLARMHLAGRDFPLRQPNLRGLAWWSETVPVVRPFLDEFQRELIDAELATQIAAATEIQALPHGPIHADLFRDNVMFDDGELTGFFDFYFAGTDCFLFDLAVCVNDWCDTSGLTEAFCSAYDGVRQRTDDELRLFPTVLRGAALRFWLSRLWDWHLPRPAALLKPHDPKHFERILRQRADRG